MVGAAFVARLVLAAALAVPTAATAQSRVAFPSSDAALTGGAPTMLAGLVWTPPGLGPFPAMVMAHGCSGLWGRDGAPSARHRDWAERFHRLGYVVLHVDSFRPRGVEATCGTPTRERVARATRERPHDVVAALAWLRA